MAETTRAPDTDTVDIVESAEGTPMQWLNEPASWQRTGDELKVSVDPGTDFWRGTGYGYLHDNGHVYGEVLPGDLDVSVRIRGNFATQYDQAGIMLRADEEIWLKTGVEYFEGRPRLSTVLTLGWSSWMVADLPADLDEITLRVSRRGDAVEVRYRTGGGLPELAALAYLPPEREMLAGVMCAAPEGNGFSVSFHDLRVAGRDWGGGETGQAQEPWQDERDDEGRPDWDTPPASAGWPEPADPPEAGQPGWAGEPGKDAARDWAALADTSPGQISLTWPAGPAAGGDSGSGTGDDAGPGATGDQSGPAPGAAGTEPAAATSGAPPTGETGWPASQPDPAAGSPANATTEPDLPAAVPDRTPAPAKLPKRKKPAVSLPPPSDPADEWISLLTADPADD